MDVCQRRWVKKKKFWQFFHLSTSIIAFIQHRKWWNDDCADDRINEYERPRKKFVAYGNKKYSHFIISHLSNRIFIAHPKNTTSHLFSLSTSFIKARTQPKIQKYHMGHAIYVIWLYFLCMRFSPCDIRHCWLFIGGSPWNLLANNFMLHEIFWAFKLLQIFLRKKH